jgi:hypothetical protein
VLALPACLAVAIVTRRFSRSNNGSSTDDPDRIGATLIVVLTI